MSLRRPISFLTSVSKVHDESFPPNVDELSSYSSNPNSLEASLSLHPSEGGGTFPHQLYPCRPQQQQQQQHPNQDHGHSHGNHHQQQQQNNSQPQWYRYPRPHPHVLIPPSPSRDHLPKRPRFGVHGLGAVESLIENIFACGGCGGTGMETTATAGGGAAGSNSNSLARTDGFASTPFMYGSSRRNYRKSDGNCNNKNIENNGKTNHNEGTIREMTTATTAVLPSMVAGIDFFRPTGANQSGRGDETETEAHNSSVQTWDTSYRMETDTLESSYTTAFLSDTGNPFGSSAIFRGGNLTRNVTQPQPQQQQQQSAIPSQPAIPTQPPVPRFAVSTPSTVGLPQQQSSRGRGSESHHHLPPLVGNQGMAYPASNAPYPPRPVGPLVSPSPAKKPYRNQPDQMEPKGPPRPPEIRRLTLQDAATQQQQQQIRHHSSETGGGSSHHRRSPATVGPASPHHSVTSSHSHPNNMSLLLPQPVCRSRSLDFLFSSSSSASPSSRRKGGRNKGITKHQRQQQQERDGRPWYDHLETNNPFRSSTVFDCVDGGPVDLDATFMTH